MKKRILLLPLPLIILFTLCFLAADLNSQGDIKSPFILKMLPLIERVPGYFTDIKFHLRGARAPKNKIVIVGVDGYSLSRYGRWPWHRDLMAHLLENIIASGARVVGLDMVFSEKDERVPPGLAKKLEKKFGRSLVDKIVETAETDPSLAEVIAANRDKIVLGWMTESACQPGLTSKEECPVSDPEAAETIPKDFERFAIPFDSPLNRLKTVAWSAPTVTPNIPDFQNPSVHQGFFNADLSADGTIRKAILLMVAGGHPFASLPLEMASVGQKAPLSVTFDAASKVQSLSFTTDASSTPSEIPISPTGEMEINFRGPGYTFEYVSAADMLDDQSVLQDVATGKLAGQNKSDVFRDAYVLVGVSALGVFDTREFPFGGNVPGVEGHVTILDNLLAHDGLESRHFLLETALLSLLMTLGALVLVYITHQLRALAALGFFIFVTALMMTVDVGLLFSRGHNWNTGYLYIELLSLFVATVVHKYVNEEGNKNFIRSAFSRYVSSAVVDAIIKDPEKLVLGGERKSLSILFSDIRNFTTFSEPMDARDLSRFLNEYFTLMTEVIFKNKGTLDKYVGDAMVAFWGAPADDPAHPLNACRAAIEMVGAVRQNKKMIKEKWNIDLKIGVGLTSGTVSVGNMGTHNNFSYTAIGDAVNLASRLEGATKHYGVEVLTTRETIDEANKAGGNFKFRIIDFVKLKGKKIPVEIVEILQPDFNSKVAASYDEARALYLAKKWAEAAKVFKEVSDADRPSQIYAERCLLMMASPPAHDWDGSHQLENK